MPNIFTDSLYVYMNPDHTKIGFILTASVSGSDFNYVGEFINGAALNFIICRDSGSSQTTPANIIIPSRSLSLPTSSITTINNPTCSIDSRSLTLYPLINIAIGGDKLSYGKTFNPQIAKSSSLLTDLYLNVTESYQVTSYNPTGGTLFYVSSASFSDVYSWNCIINSGSLYDTSSFESGDSMSLTANITQSTRPNLVTGSITDKHSSGYSNHPVGYRGSYFPKPFNDNNGMNLQFNSGVMSTVVTASLRESSSITMAFNLGYLEVGTRLTGSAEPFQFTYGITSGLLETI